MHVIPCLEWPLYIMGQHNHYLVFLGNHSFFIISTYICVCVLSIIGSTPLQELVDSPNVNIHYLTEPSKLFEGIYNTYIITIFMYSCIQSTIPMYAFTPTLYTRVDIYLVAKNYVQVMKLSHTVI